MEYYSAIRRNTFELVLMRWMNLESIIYSEVSQKENDNYHILMHIWRRKWKPIPIFLPGKLHGIRSLASYTPHSVAKSRTRLND